MATVFRCDLCSEEDTYGFFQDQQYCNKCNDLLFNMKKKIQLEVRKDLYPKFEHAVRNQVHILALCNWLFDNKRDTFKRYFGKEGEEMLRKAVQK